MRLMINRQAKRTPWGGGTHFVTLLADFMTSKGHTVVHNFAPKLDAILMIDPRPEDGLNDVNRIIAYKQLNPKVKVIHRINDTDIARGTNFLDKLNIEANRSVADSTVFISKWLKDYYVEKGFESTRPNNVILNGCDLSSFQPEGERPVAFYAGDKFKLVTHHWSDNYNKGFETYIALDKYLQETDAFEFTYVGRYFKDYKPLKTRIIPPLYGADLGAELSKHDIYVTAARYEACGMHHVEAAACGLPVAYLSSGGGVVEMCQRYGSEFEKTESVFQAFEAIKLSYGSYRARALAYRSELGSDTMCQKYLKLLESMV